MRRELTDDERLDVLGEARLQGFGGECGAVAIAINKVLFNGRGRLVAAVNEPLWERYELFVGHVGVRHRGVIWDAEGTFEGDDGIEEFRAWGMVDPHDPDYEEYITEDEAYDAVIIPMTRDYVMAVLPFCAPGNPERQLVEARRRLGL